MLYPLLSREHKESISKFTDASLFHIAGIFNFRIYLNDLVHLEMDELDVFIDKLDETCLATYFLQGYQELEVRRVGDVLL